MFCNLMGSFVGPLGECGPWVSCPLHPYIKLTIAYDFDLPMDMRASWYMIFLCENRVLQNSHKIAHNLTADKRQSWSTKGPYFQSQWQEGQCEHEHTQV